MPSLLDHCRNARALDVEPGVVLLTEGQTTGRLYVLAEGTLEVVKGGAVVATLFEPGAVVGEMSILLGRAHTATVRSRTTARVFIIDNAEAFLIDNPGVAWTVAQMLAQRLNSATTYLADLKVQYAGSGNHLGMVSDVLASLVNQQPEVLSPGSSRTDDPRI